MPDVITRYFQADARRDTDAIVALFTEDAVVSAAASQATSRGDRQAEMALHARW
jgi:ketosteroid isomerase-like protein